MLEDVKLPNRDPYICLLDTKYATDSVEHALLLRLLQAVGIAEEFGSIIESFHTHAASEIVTYHGTYKPVALTCGTGCGSVFHHRCPFST